MYTITKKEKKKKEKKKKEEKKEERSNDNKQKTNTTTTKNREKVSIVYMIKPLFLFLITVCVIRKEGDGGRSTQVVRAEGLCVWCMVRGRGKDSWEGGGGWRREEREGLWRSVRATADPK